MSEVQTEQVLVVPTERFHALGHFQGFSAKPELLEQLLLAEHTSYRSRDAVEEDPSFKQLIPYCLLLLIVLRGHRRQGWAIRSRAHCQIKTVSPGCI